MKTTIFCLLLTISFMNSCSGNGHFSKKERIAINKSQEVAISEINHNDTLLNNVQQKVINAFVDGKIKQTDKELIGLREGLQSLNKSKKNSIIGYWSAYACYYHSILHTTNGNKAESEKVLEEGIRILNEIKNKNSEHYALLALMESFSIQFAAGMKAPLISNRVKKNAETAILLDSLNLRAYYVLGSSDFYTPEQYGGGKNAEKYLIKAIGLKDQTTVNPYLPSWGKDSAYELLVRLYIRSKQYDEAKKYCKEALSIFPDHYMLNRLAAELIKY